MLRDWKNSCFAYGTPSSSQMTCDGTGSDRAGHQVGGRAAGQYRVDPLVHDLLDARPQQVYSPGGELADDRPPRHRVVRRIHADQ